VRFLVDEALQDRLAGRLADAGHDASHIRVIGMQGATDEDVLACADREGRVLVTTDTDFGTILALSGAAGPSVLLLRGIETRSTSVFARSLPRSASSRTS
jgi:predicted nuclease of predicted toxin-antitoxin system